MTHTDAIRSQIQQLEDEVRQDPRLRAIDLLKAALRILESAESVTPPNTEAPNPNAPPEAPSSKPSASVPRGKSKIMRTYDIVGRHVDAHGPTHRTVLVDELTKAGLMEGVKNPLIAFATSMHALKEHFASDGFGTWTRREGAPTEVVPIWAKKHEGSSLPTSSAQAETGGVVAPPAASVA